MSVASIRTCRYVNIYIIRLVTYVYCSLLHMTKHGALPFFVLLIHCADLVVVGVFSIGVLLLYLGTVLGLWHVYTHMLIH